MSTALVLPDHVTEEIKAATLKQPVEWFFNALSGGRVSDAGVLVNGVTVLTHGPVWQAVNILAGDIGQVPFSVYRGLEEETRHPAYPRLRISPNDFQVPAVWKETMMQYALIWGNAIAPIVRRGSTIAALGIPIHPTNLRGWEADGDEMFYRVWDESAGSERQLAAANAFHIRGLSTDGVWGHSLVEVAKNVFGHGLALQKHGNAVFRNNGRPSGVLEHPGVLAPEERKNLRSDWESVHAGAEQSGKIAVLWNGMKFNAVSMSNEDAQWLEARRLDREMVASLFNLPAFKLNALENSAVRANLEEQNRDYFQTSLSRWFNFFKEEGESKLLRPAERQTHHLEWDVDDFLKGDRKTRIETNAMAIQSLQLTPDEARGMEGLEPLPDGTGEQVVNPNTAPTPLGNMSESHRELLKDAVRRILEVEQARVKQCLHAKNFVRSLDKFYNTTFPELASVTLAPVLHVLRDVGVEVQDPDELIERHSRISHASLVELAGEHKGDTIKAATRELVASWSERLEWWMEELY